MKLLIINVTIYGKTFNYNSAETYSHHNCQAFFVFVFIVIFAVERWFTVNDSTFSGVYKKNLAVVFKWENFNRIIRFNLYIDPAIINRFKSD